MYEPLTLAAFRQTLEQLARQRFAGLRDPPGDVAATLWAEVAPGQVAVVASYEVYGLDEVGKVELALDLNVRLRSVGALKGGWLMPAYQADGMECLVLLVAGAERSEAVVAPVSRGPWSAPTLGQWSQPTVSVDGLFVTPLVEAVRPREPAAECRARGWYAKRADVGWQPCAPGEPGAREDLNRWIWFRDHGYDGHYEI